MIGVMFAHFRGYSAVAHSPSFGAINKFPIPIQVDDADYN